MPIAEQVGLPSDPETLVKINAGVQIGAGALLVLGIFPRVASLALAATLVPTTLAGHRFWEAKGDERLEQLFHFAKNAVDARRARGRRPRHRRAPVGVLARPSRRGPRFGDAR